MLSEIFDCVLRYLDTDDIKQSRLVCTTWREEVDCLISSIALKRVLHVPEMVARFQVRLYTELRSLHDSDISRSRAGSQTTRTSSIQPILVSHGHALAKPNLLGSRVKHQATDQLRGDPPCLQCRA